ncbi:MULTISPECIES: phosphoribosyltransferase family protein [unclassified Wenzhouxiangella]|uniref:phosphoribosyltransferase family protein n=1 Tax=unclassified Wenzhouxiangella TaxID=2613841 RepID=UPI000E328886|nr:MULTISPECIES: phosphoribosyltransferase family protein [unclassified Wenzhouxiangella]RFF28309.1 hypoxanthine-guanine phosphoribosyltransferase [Wenzhouxiangella sp. 15181]RFP67766.1 hypoxanthine-guanine phosphoribosyltransferase [Wenzhouxiangella sp. 15190]
MPDSVHENPRWPDGAECLFSEQDVSRALDAQAERIGRLAAADEVLSVIALMKGGMYPAVELSRRLGSALRIDYVHATRYREATSGGEIHWQHWPGELSPGDHVVVVDDIFDEGYTMQAVVERLEEQGVQRVTTAVLARKQHDRGLDRDWVDDHALEVPDRYVFGCGMDYQGLWRQLEGIWALPS